MSCPKSVHQIATAKKLLANAMSIRHIANNPHLQQLRNVLADTLFDVLDDTNRKATSAVDALEKAGYTFDDCSHSWVKNEPQQIQETEPVTDQPAPAKGGRKVAIKKTGIENTE